jgi:hypothetical protein
MSDGAATVTTTAPVIRREETLVAQATGSPRAELLALGVLSFSPCWVGGPSVSPSTLLTSTMIVLPVGLVRGDGAVVDRVGVVGRVITCCARRQ